MNFKVYQITYIHSKTTLPNRLGQLNISPRKSNLYIHPGHGDITWYHHNLYAHKSRGYSQEKYGAVQVHFGKVVLPW